MKSDPNCGAMGAGAGGGNRAAAGHVMDQHTMADMNTMVSKQGVSSKVKPTNKPSHTGSPTVGQSQGKRSFSKQMD